MMAPEVNSIAAALRRLFYFTDSEREQMGRNGQSLVEQHYQWQQIGKSMTKVYDWILGQGPKPDCILS